MIFLNFSRSLAMTLADCFEWRPLGLKLPDARRAWDVFGSLVLLAAALPAMALVALAIFVFNGRPVLFKQRRVTRNGQVFTLYKFRTMVPEAEQDGQAVFAAPGDPRVFPLGRFLRRYRIDELPQLFNVLLGDMSLVGPRPERPEMVQQLGRSIKGFRRRMEVKAGLTGLAQIRAEYADNVESYRRKVALDRLYLRKRSFLFDMLIIAKTARVVMFPNGR